MPKNADEPPILQCSFIPKFHTMILTRFEDNNGSSENCLGLSEAELKDRSVDSIDIAFEEVAAHHYKKEEDPKVFKSQKTGRGPLVEGWRESDKPIMCSYKVVKVSFEVWGFQTKVEDFIQKCVRDVLLLGHRQAFAWIDEWLDMSIEDVREYERQKQQENNEKFKRSASSASVTPKETTAEAEAHKKQNEADEKSCQLEDLM